MVLSLPQRLAFGVKQIVGMRFFSDRLQLTLTSWGVRRGCSGEELPKARDRRLQEHDFYGMNVSVHRVVMNDVTRLGSLACPQRPCQEARYYPLRSALCDTSYTATTES